MNKSGYNFDEKQKLVVAFWAALLFMLLASPMAFKLTNKLFKKMGVSTLDADGKVSVVGLLLHSVVYMVLFRVMMMLPVPTMA